MPKPHLTCEIEVPIMSPTLDQSELDAAVSTLPNWKLEQGELTRTVTFSDFKQALDFVNRVAAFAEAANHHPDIDIRYNKVRLSLVTHDSGGITRKDVDLAKSIDTALPK
jgi:4a-hydroxytetrahydrobiopterin dehydratase